ncbi:MAG: rhomboid family intramembrane serine protease [Prevotellaceae bacterium]|jgi:membrane associated rhomboid family serine protease|nr:rhomboid family intramembrane serine protease [Prevotellaceae bacterium]
MFNSRNSFFNNIPFITKNLILINILMWFATIVAPRAFGMDLTDVLGLHYFASQGFKPIQIISYMFMHAGFDHLFFNMFALFMFGGVIEQAFGRKRFLTFYFVCGIGAAAVQMLILYFQIQHLQAELPFDVVQKIYTEGADLLAQNYNYTDVAMGKLNSLLNSDMVGASGAVFGLLLAFGMLFPNQQIYIYFLLPLKAKWFVILYGLLEFFFGVSNNSGDNVAHFAHLGGMLFGFLLLMWWRWEAKSNNNKLL